MIFCFLWEQAIILMSIILMGAYHCTSMQKQTTDNETRTNTSICIYLGTKLFINYQPITISLELFSRPLI
jgi:hypothetical protein